MWSEGTKLGQHARTRKHVSANVFFSSRWMRVLPARSYDRRHEMGHRITHEERGYVLRGKVAANLETRVPPASGAVADLTGKGVHV